MSTGKVSALPNVCLTGLIIGTCVMDIVKTNSYMECFKTIPIYSSKNRILVPLSVCYTIFTKIHGYHFFAIWF